MYVNTIQIDMNVEKAWPFPVHEFDCSPNLSEEELDNLSSWYEARLSASTLVAQNLKKLSRLVRPIETALAYCKPDKRFISNTRNQLLLQVYKKRTSIWAWTLDEWLDYIGRSPADHQVVVGEGARNARINLAICAYLLTDINVFNHITGFPQAQLVRKLFGAEVIDPIFNKVREEMSRLGYGMVTLNSYMHLILSEAFLLNRSCDLHDITAETLEILQSKKRYNIAVQHACLSLSQVLYNMGITSRHIKKVRVTPWVQVGVNDSLSAEWFEWITRWFNTSTLCKNNRLAMKTTLGRIGRWLNEVHGLSSPLQWNHEISISFVSAVDRMKDWEYSHPVYLSKKKGISKPLNAHSKSSWLCAARTFFLDCQEWEWIPVTFNPIRSIYIPRSITAQHKTNPRVIADDVWAKLMHAGLSLVEEDLINNNAVARIRTLRYPFEMVKAVAIVWLFTGLRHNEIRRLRLGCTRWQSIDPENPPANPDNTNSVCLLTVPVNKTSGEFVKPVDYIVGTTIQAWEKIRPSYALFIDEKTSENIDYLFFWCGVPLGKNYINLTLIPLLCKKVGIPQSDLRGRITSHRARSTIATQLYNAREPFSLFELQEWMGHNSPSSTQFYAKITPNKLAKSFKNAEYFKNNIRIIEVLLNQDAINKETGNDESILHYDLVHGYCTYTFFEKCPHRMACAKCSFYRPKDSAYVQVLEAKNNLLRFQQNIPLSDEELRVVVDDDIEVLEKMVERLSNTPAPDGEFPANSMPSIKSKHQKQ